MNQYREIIGKLNYGLFLAIVALLPFDQLLLRYAFVTWFVCWLLEGRWLNIVVLGSGSRYLVVADRALPDIRTYCAGCRVGRKQTLRLACSR